MSISNQRWSKFKQEFIPILYLSVFGTLLNFNFPFFVGLGAPLSTLVMVCMSVLTTIGTALIFSYADTRAYQYNYEYLGDSPLRQPFIVIHRASMIVSFHLVFFILWYKDLYGMSNMHYALFYMYVASAMLLMDQAINRSRS